MSIHLLLWCCVVVATVNIADAGVILGNPTTTVVSTNFTDGSALSYNAAALTVRFTKSDSSLAFAQQQGPTGPTEYYIVQTEPEKYAFSALALKYGPENIFIYSNRACAIDATADVNLTSEVYIPTSSAGRRLLWQESRDLTNGIVRRGGPARQLQTSDSFAVSECLGPVISVGLGASIGGGIGAGNCDALNDMINNPAIAAAADAASHLANATAYWAADITAIQATNLAINTQMQISIQSNLVSTLLLQNASTQQAGALVAQSKVIDANFAAAQVGIQSIGLQAAQDIVALSQLTDGKLIGIQNNFINTTNAIVVQFNSTVATLNQNQNRVDSTVRNLARLLRSYQLKISKGLAGTNEYIDSQQLRQIWNAILDAESKGRVVMGDPSNLGSAPTPMTSLVAADLLSFVDKTLINFVNITASVTRIHQLGINFFVNLAAVNQRGITAGSWQDIQDIIGPDNCTDASGSTVLSCIGWFEITHTFCTRPSSPTPFTWESITTISDRSAYVLGASQCGTTPTVDGVWNGRKLDTVDQLHDFIGAACLSQSLVTGTAFQLVSTRVGRTEIQPNYSNDVCFVNTDAIFLDGSISAHTLPYTLYSNWVLSFSAMTTERNALTAKINGVRPRGFTNTFLPFYGLPNGKSYTCFQTEITTFDPATEIYYRMSPIGVTPQVSIKVYDQQWIEDCSVTPCLLVPQGNLLRTEIPDSIDINTMNPQNGGIYDPGLLPTSSTILFGDLSSGAMASVFDIPASLSNLAPDPRSRAGHVDYTSWPIPSSYSVAGTTSGGPPVADLPTWESDNPGQLYDTGASVSPGYYRHAVQTSDGICTTVAGVPFNAVCNMLNSFVVDPSTNMRQGHLVLTPRDYTMVVNFKALAGPVILRVQPGCPDQVFDPNNILGRLLILTNSLPYDISIIVVRTNTVPACPTADFLATIPAKGYVNVPFAACGNYTAQVYSAAVDVLSSPTACGAPITAALQAETQENLAVSLLVNQTSIAVTSELSAGLAGVNLQLVSLILGIVSQSVPGLSLTVAGIDFSSDNATINGIVAGLIATSNGIDLTSNTATGAIAPFIDRLNAIQSDLNSSISVATESLANLTTLIAIQTAQVAQAKADLLVLQADTAAAIQANTDLANSIRSNSGFGSNQGCSALGFPADMWCYVEQFLIWMAEAAVLALGAFGFYRLFQCFYRNRGSFKSSKKIDMPPRNEFAAVPTSGRARVLMYPSDVSPEEFANA